MSNGTAHCARLKGRITHGNRQTCERLSFRLPASHEIKNLGLRLRPIRVESVLHVLADTPVVALKNYNITATRLSEPPKFRRVLGGGVGVMVEVAKGGHGGRSICLAQTIAGLALFQSAASSRIGASRPPA